MCLAACADLAPEAGEHAEPIINGVIDTENPAAIAFGQGSFPFASCSGTIVKVEGNQGWALTAAHCADNIQGALVLMGHLNQAPRQFPIIEVVANPDYDEVIHTYWNDYAIVRFAGADDTVPVVPIATPAEESLAAGDIVTLVGYGQIEGGGTSMERRSITRPIQDLDPDTFTYDQTTGGICFGDSGGPAFADLPVGRRVVGVTTVVSDQDCAYWGGSARVKAYYASFLEPVLEKPTFDACWKCFGSAFGTSTCNALMSACFQPGSQCETYQQCRQGCAGDTACQATCAASYPQGATQYDEMLACPCDACGAACSDEIVCGGTAAGCGFISDEPACSVCIDGCCAEARACADDPSGCGSCFPNCEPPNAAADALLTCLEASSCVETCGLDLVIVPPGEGGGGEGGAGPATVSSSAATTSVTTGAGGLGGAGGSVASASGGGATPYDDDDGGKRRRDKADDADGDGCSAARSPRDASLGIFVVALVLASLARRRRA